MPGDESSAPGGDSGTPGAPGRKPSLPNDSMAGRPKNPASPTSPSKEEIASMKFYVDAVNGNDSNNGKTLKTPVKTLAKAQALVRAVAQSVNNHVTVYIRGGVYTMREPLIFDGELDSLPGGKTVTYKNYDNEKVYISGGMALNNWTISEHGENIVKALVPEGLNTHDLYVNGKPAVRAKTDVSLSSLITWNGGREIKYLDGGDLARAGGDVEVVFKYQWNTHRSIASVKADDVYSILTLEPVTYQLLTAIPYAPTTKEDIWYLENSIEFLNKPGEWCFDKSEKAIYYMLRGGEKADSLNAYAGVSESLITSDTNSTLKNITFEGLTFCNTTWMRPLRTGGYVTRQGGFYVSLTTITAGDAEWRRPEAAIRLFQTDGVKFINNSFVNLGNSGIDMERAKNARISGNLFTDCGGSAFILGGFTTGDYHSPEDESIITEDCEISNNYIHDICTNMISSCGATVGYGRNIDFINNTIHNLPYTGLSYGWGWGGLDHTYTPKSLGGRIANNHIYNVVKDIIDGGAIYTLSRRDGLLIENNYVHSNTLWFGGIYLDNRSAGYTVRKNVVRNCQTNLVFTSYNVNAYDNYLDVYSQSELNNSAAKVVFVSFRDANGQVTAEPNAPTFGIVGIEEWLTLDNSYSAPSGDTTKAANTIIAAAGVTPEYKAWFGIK